MNIIQYSVINEFGKTLTAVSNIVRQNVRWTCQLCQGVKTIAIDTAEVVTVRCELQQAAAAHLTVWLTPLTLNTMLCSAHIVLGPSLSTKLGLFLFVRSIRSRSASYLAIKKSLRRVSQTKDKFGPQHIYIGLSYLFENRHLSLLFAIGCFQCALAYFK